MRRLLILTGAFALTIASAPASTARLDAQASGDATKDGIKLMWDVVKGYITKAAAQVPEDKYKFQPTKDVRTMAQLFGHIANASTMICDTASGMKSAPMGDAEKLATKAEIQKALATSFANCDHAFDMINAKSANESVTLFGTMKHSRLSALAFNNAHDFEHYGNIVTYMRINGMVPPSSGGK